MLKENGPYLHHILDECNYITSVTDSITHEKFIEDGTLSRAVLRSLEIIGEASKKISTEFKEANSSVPWKEMSGLRDVLIHNYFGINYSIVWDVVTNKIPELKTMISSLFQNND